MVSPSDSVPRLWTLWKAARPSQLALIVLVYALGVGMAVARRAPRQDTFVDVLSNRSITVGVLALLAVATSVHYANEFVDVETDRRTTRTPFSGGSGALEQAGIGRDLLARAMAVTLLVGTLVAIAGAVSGTLSGPAVGLLAVVALAGLAYSLPPTALVRRGAGEVVNALLGGLLLPLYGVAVVATPQPADAVALLPFVCLVGCNLLATHWPDRDADASVGKRTLAVRWAPSRLRRTYWTLAAVATGVTVLLVGTAIPRPVGAAQAATVPLLLWGGIVLTRQRSPFPAVAAMVTYAVVTTGAWWWVATAMA